MPYCGPGIFNTLAPVEDATGLNRDIYFLGVSQLLYSVSL